MKIMIINWRWGAFPQSNKHIRYDFNNAKQKLLFITKFTDKQISDFNNEIKNILENNQPQELLILTHNNPGSLICIPTKSINVISDNKIKIKVREFMGGTDYIYWGAKNKEGMIDTQEGNYRKQLIKNNFDNVWDYYWNKLDLEYQKKRIIDLWLPLAIDMQGLSELKSKSNIDNYINAIETDIDNYANTLIKDWNDVKSILGLKKDYLNSSETVEEFLDEKYRLEDDKKEIIYFPLEKEITNDTLKEYVKTLYDRNNKNYLPKWLQEVVNTIDNKIKESNQEDKNKTKS